ncbi:MAG: hypothetical protein LQ350_007160 [Teloschistes chrysophthalmus]|nr:MAG: hypothetical protein LQ350_007160 [Niorma chrysophthalma]
MVGGELPKRIRQLHQQYGPIVRIAPDELTFINPAAWRDIYPPNFVRPREYKDKPPGKNAKNLISANEADHARFRKILAPAFSEKAVCEQEPMVMGHVNTVMEKLLQQIDQGGQGVGAIVDLLQWFNYAFFDIIGEFVWGSSFSCLEQEKEHPWIQVIAKFKITIIAGCLKYYPPLDSLLQAITPKSAMADLWMIWRTTEEKISQRMKQPGNNHRDVMSHMLATDQAQMTREEIEINSMLLVIAGSESTTTLLLAIMNHLLRNPAKMNALTKEIRSAHDTDGAITGSSLSKLPYLAAVLQEGLRLCPPFSDGLRRVVPEGGATVADQYLPAGTVVSIPQLAAYSSSDNFFEPTLFLPERWLAQQNDPSSPYAKDRRDVFVPFSLGPHNCPGRSLALLESRLMLAKLLWRFDVTADTLPLWEEQKIYWFWEKQSLKVRIQKRKHE